MKTIGDQAQKYRVYRGWNSTRMAKEVGTSRQNIESLEKVGARTPHYISDLARVMKTTVDVLMRGEYEIEGVLSDDQEPAERKPYRGNTMIQVPINLNDNPEYPSIRRVNIKANAGVTGYAVEYMLDDGPPIVFRADWYKSKGYKPEKMLAVRVMGESMIPSMYEGDLIVINTLQTLPKQGLPFCVSYEGEVLVKRLVRDDGLWWLTSDNPDQRRYPRTKCNGSTEIIGEVVYRQTERV